MEPSIFEKIISRELAADIIYEDEDTMAFMDVAPNTRGHALVIPKKPVINIFDTDEETLAAVMRTVRTVAPAVRDAVGAKGVHINSNHGAEAGQLIFHMHFHIIPRHDRHDYEFCWPKIEYAPGEAAEIAEKIRAAIKTSGEL